MAISGMFADWAATAVLEYTNQTGDPAGDGRTIADDDLSQLLASLMHLCAQRGWSFDDALHRAQDTFQHELREVDP